MVNFNEVINNIRPLLFGRVSINEYIRELNILCKIDQEDIKITGKLMVDKNNGRVILHILTVRNQKMINDLLCYVKLIMLRWLIYSISLKSIVRDMVMIQLLGFQVDLLIKEKTNA